MNYRILSMDGGGSRALIPVALLERIHERNPSFLDSVDLLAGGSTSAISALIIADNKHPADALDNARKLWIQGKKLFASDNLRTLAAIAGTCAYFSNHQLAAELKKIFGDRTIGDLKRKITVPLINMGDKQEKTKPIQWKPVLIHNFDKTYSKLTLVEAGLRAAALPILFPVRGNHIDGSLIANNPSLCAVSHAIKYTNTQLKDLSLLSIGTGENPLGMHAGNNDSGYANWFFDHELPLGLLQTVIETNGCLTDEQCRQLLSEEQYYRINPPLPKTWLIHEHHPRFVLEAAMAAETAPIENLNAWLVKPGRRTAKKSS